MKKNIVFTVLLNLLSILFGQSLYNHPEINWQTFETDHFNIHFYDVTEHSAREGAEVAERVYPIITDLYDYEPQQKTHIIFTDVDDISKSQLFFSAIFESFITSILIYWRQGTRIKLLK